MQTNFILALTGPDRIGIVDEVTGLLLEHEGNVETSRMARLGGEFAVLMLVTIPEEQFPRLERALDVLTAQGYKVTTTQTGHSYAQSHLGWIPFLIEVRGADHEGIIHEVAHYLSAQGISIESMDSESAPGATSGVPLFAMTAQVVVPPGLGNHDWQSGLEGIGSRLNLDITVSTNPANYRVLK